MSRFVPLLIAASLTLASCGQRGGFVYVLEEPQSMTLNTSASSTSVAHRDTIVLRVERRTTGKWKRIPFGEVQPGQCWEYQPPAEAEPEVADLVHWQIVPENGAALSRDFRTDHTKAATMLVKGIVTFTPISAVKCEDRRVEGTPIQIEVK